MDEDRFSNDTIGGAFIDVSKICSLPVGYFARWPFERTIADVLFVALVLAACWMIAPFT